MGNYSYRQRYLKPLNKKRTIKRYSVFDIETNSWIDDSYLIDDNVLNEYHNRDIIPFLLIFYDGKKYNIYDGKRLLSDFLYDFLRYNNRNTICFSHNGGKFDILALYQEFMRNPDFYDKYSFQPIMQGSRIMSFKIKDENKNIWEFRDSFSLLPKSLFSLCQSFKPNHIKLERPDLQYKYDKERWINYCLNDCYSLYEIIEKFINIISDVNGNIGYTIAGTSLATYRKNFLDCEIETYHIYNDYFRKAYYGGRTEIFKMYAHENDSPFYLYDINSLYPYVMKKYRYPIGRPIRLRYQSIKELYDKTGIAYVKITAPENLYVPVLPYHNKNGKLLFPLGSWEGLYEYSFIVKAVEMGYKIKIIYAWEILDEYIFKRFVDRFYDLKNNSQGAEKEIYKLILNSLYGKFGERSEHKEMITDNTLSFEGLQPFDTKFGYVIKKTVHDSAYHLPVISIKITTMAQLTLYSYIEMIQELGGKIYYCDTDSIITDIRIPTSSKLGDLKLETEFQKGIFLAPKTYILHTYDNDEYKIKIKGFSENIKKHLNNFNIWENALKKHDYTPFNENRIRPASLNEIRIRHLNGFVTLLEKKNIKTGYDKRKILDDYDTRPLII